MNYQNIQYIYYLEFLPSHFSSTEDFLCKLSILEPNIHIVFPEKPNSEIEQLLIQRGCRYSIFSIQYLIQNLNMFPKLKFLIVGFTRLNFQQQIKLSLHRSKYILVWHNSIYHEDFVRQPFAKLKYKLKYFFVSHIISVSRTALTFIEVIGIPYKKTKLIYNGVKYDQKITLCFVAFKEKPTAPLAYKQSNYPHLNVVFVYPKADNQISLLSISKFISEKCIDIDISDKDKFHQLFPRGLIDNKKPILDKQTISSLSKLLIFKNLAAVHSIQNKRRNILFAGSLENFKGFNIVLDSVSELKDYNIFVAGNGALLNDLKEAANQHNHLFYLGEVNNLSQMYRHFDFLLLPSVWHESFCLTGVEAQQYGVHVIASRRGALCEVLTPELTTYLDDLSKQALVKAINTADRIEKGNESLSQYTTTRQAREYIEFLHTIDN